MAKLRNLERERMEYLRKVQNNTLKALDAHAEKILEEEMWKIAETNQKLLNANTPTFFFAGRWWPVTKVPDPQKCNRILHVNLYEDVQKIIEKRSFKDQEVMAGVKTLIGVFLSMAGHTEDLERLFPAALKKYMPRIDPEVFNIAEPLSEEKIEQMLINNKNNLRYLKRMLVTQLLLIKAA